MLDNVYINEINGKQRLYMIRSYCREGFSHSFDFFVVSKGIPSKLETARKQRFFNGATSKWFLYVIM